jgi:hypothetical protein
MPTELPWVWNLDEANRQILRLQIINAELLARLAEAEELFRSLIRSIDSTGLHHLRTPKTGPYDESDCWECIAIDKTEAFLSRSSAPGVKG